MAFRYHLSHFRCLSPPTNMIAFRFGSNTNSMRTSLLPEDPGLSSFIEGMRLDPFILPTIGRLRSGPCSSSNDTAASICTRDLWSSVFSQSAMGSNSTFHTPTNIPYKVCLRKSAKQQGHTAKTTREHIAKGDAPHPRPHGIRHRPRGRQGMTASRANAWEKRPKQR